MAGAILRGAVLGAMAGAAGTTALNAVTYLDMAVRGRPVSTVPERTIEVLAGRAVPGGEDTRGNRISGLAGLAGLSTGVAVGALFGVLRVLGVRSGPASGAVVVGAAAMAAADVPLVRLGITDPRTWGVSGWLSDIVPHLAYGAVTAATLDALDHR
ncbi:MAG: hypothetical protein QOI35_3647 [Cryptosporangiaceae bacterium]|jgi:hypothetical protein|nr:hypothetical protein [Cryptosporangiaceae bacterium]